MRRKIQTRGGRHKPSRFEHSVRQQQMIEAVKRYPGETAPFLARQSGCPCSSAHGALCVLQDRGKVRREVGLKASRWFPVLLLVLILSGCSIGGQWSPEGPHPHISPAGAIHVGPIEVLHSPVTNAKPVTDLTVATVTVGWTVGPVYLSAGPGWQVSRVWDGPCDSTGNSCQKSWFNGWAVVVGITYHYGRFRADLRGFSYDNSPVGARSNLPLELEAVVLLFGFGL